MITLELVLILMESTGKIIFFPTRKYCCFFLQNRTPKGLEDVSKYPNLFDALIKSNETRWTHENLEKLAGRNFIRVFRKVEEVINTKEFTTV